MTKNHKRFFSMLDRVHRIKHIWDKNKLMIDIDLLEKELSVMSPGEAHIAKFFVSLWFGDNKQYGFDLVDAIAYLDKPEQDLIIEWIANPFWP